MTRAWVLAGLTAATLVCRPVDWSIIWRYPVAFVLAIIALVCFALADLSNRLQRLVRRGIHAR